MLHIIAKCLSSLAVIVIGLGGGYFGAAAYYEGNPQSVAQSGELKEKTSTIGWENKDVLLAVSSYENSKAWKRRESFFRSSSETPSASPFKELKTSITTSTDTDIFRKTCWQVYQTSSSDSEKTNKANDAKKYCSLKPSS